MNPPKQDIRESSSLLSDCFNISASSGQAKETGK